MTGAELIAAERQRQIDVEGYPPERDRTYTSNELVWAAGAYLMHGVACAPAIRWPWHPHLFKPARCDCRAHEGYWTPDHIEARVKDLKRAGALIAAEIDRLNNMQGDRG